MGLNSRFDIPKVRINKLEQWFSNVVPRVAALWEHVGNANSQAPSYL